MTFLLAQISDTHVIDSRHDGELYVDNNARLAEAVERLLAESILPDAVLLTGDLTDHGTPEAMGLCSEMLSILPMPLLAIPGNHDRRSTFRQTFDLPWASDTNLSWRLDVGPVAVVGLDTLAPDPPSDGDVDHSGLFNDERAAWLEQTLVETSPRPTAIAMHHPPFDSGIHWMDGSGLANRERFAKIVNRHDHVTRIFCGHLHRPITTVVGGAVATTGISTVHHVELDFRAEAPIEVICDPPGYQLHAFDEGIWTSHTRFFSINDGPISPNWTD